MPAFKIGRKTGNPEISTTDVSNLSSDEIDYDNLTDSQLDILSKNVRSTKTYNENSIFAAEAALDAAKVTVSAAGAAASMAPSTPQYASESCEANSS